MEILGIKFAPINIPLKRRIETFSAFLWVLIFPFGGFMSMFLMVYLMLFTRLYVLGLLYIVWLYFDRHTPYRGGRSISFFRRIELWKHLQDFFPLKMVKTCPLLPDRNYLFCVHPHGILPIGIICHFCSEVTDFTNLYPELKPHVCTLNMHFNTPIYRDLILSIGTVSSSKESMEYILNKKEKGQVAVLAVGGAAEALYSNPGVNKILLKNRKGFIKVALNTGCSIVPVYSFGEIELYEQVSNPPGSFIYKFQTWFKNLTGIAPCIPIGRGVLQYSFGPVPRRCPINTVVGKPINVPKEENPSSDLIDHYHKLYVEELIKLFDEHKHKYVQDPEKTNLIIM